MGLLASNRTRFGFFVALALLLSESHGAATNEQTRPEVSVHIVPSSSDASGRWLDLASDGSKHFYVVVTNWSKDPIRIWKDWCSWGYGNLSFEARDSGGSVTVISKRPGEWDKNFPCPVEIEPGGSWVIPVALEPILWQHSPVSGNSGKTTMRLRAVYEIRETKDSKEMRVWTGKVSSPEGEYKLYWK
jgi:hypothetical protein